MHVDLLHLVAAVLLSLMHALVSFTSSTQHPTPLEALCIASTWALHGTTGRTQLLLGDAVMCRSCGRLLYDPDQAA